CILGDVDQYWSGPAALGNVERLCQYRWNFIGIRYLVVPFCYRRGDVYDIRLLKGIGTKQVTENLPGNTNQRRTINLCVSKTGHQVRCTGSAGREHNTNLA